jgi:hypothetical protein
VELDKDGILQKEGGCKEELLASVLDIASRVKKWENQNR